MKKIVCALLMSVVALGAMAQEEREDNRLGWNVALQGGPHFSAFENTKHASFGDCISGHAALSVGYDFTHAFGTRLEVSYGKNVSGTNTKESGRPVVLYHCKDVSVFADAIFNLSYLGGDKRPNYEVEAKGYVGIGVGMPDKGTDPNYGYYNPGDPKTAFGMRIGAIAEWHATQRLGFLVDGCVTGYSDKFNGADAGVRVDLRLGLSFGVIYHF